MSGAGEYRQRVTVQSLTLVEDGGGGHTEEWETVSTRWAAIEPTSGLGQELLQAMRAETRVTHRVRLRYLPAPPDPARFLYQGRVLDQRGARIDVDERREEWEYSCEETGPVPATEAEGES